MLDKINIPPEAKEKISKAVAAVGPVLNRLGDGLNTVLTAGRVPTLGDTFRHICVVGLNRSELLLAGENAPVFSDNWQDLADENLRRSLGMVFFAPRGLDGKPVNPYLFLAGDTPEGSMAMEGGDEEEEAFNDSLPLAQQLLAGMGLLDFCRMPRAEPNTVNIMLAADVLFHWDVQDNYVLPTTTTGWVRDVEQVLAGYPRTTKAVLYTSWETEILPPTDRITVRKLRDMPIHEATWLNKPTVQEKYGNHVLALSMLIATATWLMLHFQQGDIDEVNEQLRIVEQQIPREGRFAQLARAVSDQEKTMEKRELYYLAVKDTGRAISRAGMKFESFEIRVPDPQQPPVEYVVTIEGMKDVYQGWLEEEPIAKNVLLNSAMMVAVRKPPANNFRLEGLIPLRETWDTYRKLGNPLAGGAAAAAAVEQTEDEDEGGAEE